eukprot:TRINITY_DN56036_c0_g1_i1.p1 TRINITY_DN56036_c0_g1~~TRINITY_DN56036_c0_g1_i1.p1  ORF type:complete len:244 (+),score=32.25 TRINITY_DN56036_c0_g1_i1:32-733(+)
MTLISLSVLAAWVSLTNNAYRIHYSANKQLQDKQDEGDSGLIELDQAEASNMTSGKTSPDMSPSTPGEHVTDVAPTRSEAQVSGSHSPARDRQGGETRVAKGATQVPQLPQKQGSEKPASAEDEVVGGHSNVTRASDAEDLFLPARSRYVLQSVATEEKSWDRSRRGRIFSGSTYVERRLSSIAIFVVLSCIIAWFGLQVCTAEIQDKLHALSGIPGRRASMRTTRNDQFVVD